MNRAKVAIYMSCYNHEKYVADAVNSILSQTYTNWELYVVDDGSTDRTGEILETYDDERIHYYHFEKNTRFIGAANFLQKLIEELDVDYIADLASDDMWKKDKLEKQIDILENYPEYQSCFTWDELLFCKEDDVYKGNENYSHVSNRNRFDWVYRFWYFGNCINACSMMVRKNVFYELGRMNEVFIQLGDYRLWLMHACKYPFYLIEEPLTYYRRHDTNLSAPSLETTIRSYNESFVIKLEVLKPMSKELFRRSFYKCLPYVAIQSETELLAAKFVFAASGNSSQTHQVATTLYYENCETDTLAELLEERYFFGPREFVDFAGRGGMQTAILDKEFVKSRLTTEFNEYMFSASAVFLSSIDNGRVTKDTLSQYAYTCLLEIYDTSYQTEGGQVQFDRLTEYVKKLRTLKLNEADQLNSVFIVAESSKFDVEQYIQLLKEMNSKENYYIAYIPRMKELLLKNKNHNQKQFEDTSIQYIELVDWKNRCLFFLDELSITPDKIYFVDTLDEEYETVSMMAGYSIAVEMNCVVSAEMQEETMRNLVKQLNVMDNLITY